MAKKFDVFSEDFDVEECKIQAERGNPDAQVGLAYCYIFGLHGVEENNDKGFEYAQLAAKQNSPRGFDCLGECYEYGYGCQENGKKAFECYEKSAKMGYAEGWTDLGVCYRDGIGIEKDEAKAFECFKKATELGHDYALIELGNCHELGIGTGKDEPRAFDCYKRAADLNNPKGIERLGICYFLGIGTEENPEQARKFLEDAADKDSSIAIYFLSIYHEEKEEFEKAFNYLKKGTKLESCHCQVRLGRYYLKGLGTSKDDYKAYKLIHEAAVKYEDGDALYWLSWCYHTGTGVAKDDDMAETYYQKAVEKGYSPPEDKKENTLEAHYNKQQSQSIKKSDKLPLNYKDNKTDVKNCIAFIQTDTGEGSGFVISSNGLIATCEHVVGDAKKIYVKLPDGKDGWIIYKASIYKSNRETDTAIIQIEDSVNLDFLQLDFDRKAPDLGEEIVMYGYPLGTHLDNDALSLNMSFAKGVVASNQSKNGRRFTTLDIHAVPGNSGSPIISEENGMVIGHLTGAILDNNATAEINYMIPVEYLGVLLNEPMENKEKEVKFSSKNKDDEQEKKEETKTDSESDEQPRVLGVVKGALDKITGSVVDIARKIPKNKGDEQKPEEKTEPVDSSQPEDSSDNDKQFKTWAEVKRFLRKKYVVAKEDNDFLAFDFTLERERTQRVCVEKMETEYGDIWITIFSAIGLIDKDEIDEVLEYLSRNCFGGLIKIGDCHWVRYSTLMETVTEKNLIEPIPLIAQLADCLEEKYIGGDQY